MTIRVLTNSRSLPSFKEPTYVLMHDNWNDYSFRTLYQLYLIDGSSTKYLGAVKILRLGQVAGEGPQINDDFEALDNDFVSVGQSLDYYQHLAELGDEERGALLRALRDFLVIEDLGLYRKEEGWRRSLFRDFKEDASFIQLARSLLSSDYSAILADNLTFAFKPEGWSGPVSLDFGVPVEPREAMYISRQVLPSRVFVLIGRNGSGKSTFLARLARVAHASARQRKRISAIGQIEPVGIGFPRVVTISYSAFDSFQLPGVTLEERKQVVKDIRAGEGRFIFCGLRDVAKELEADLAVESGADIGTQDRVSMTSLKSISELADEFEMTLGRVRNNGDGKTFNAAWEMVRADVSFTGEGPAEDLLFEINPRAYFLSLSTGHKIVLHTLANLVAHTTPSSLVLFDEPETHLHPPLLAAFMHAFRYVLKTKEAFAVVASHSPVVLQETLAMHVAIIRREGSLVSVRSPRLQTFGENAGALITEVFGLNAEVTDFHRVLDVLVSRSFSIDGVEAAFGPDGLSLQARAYVMSSFAEGSE